MKISFGVVERSTKWWKMPFSWSGWVEGGGVASQRGLYILYYTNSYVFTCRSVSVSAKPTPPSRLLAAPSQPGSLGQWWGAPASSTRKPSPTTSPTASSFPDLQISQAAPWKILRRILATESGSSMHFLTEWELNLYLQLRIQLLWIPFQFWMMNEIILREGECVQNGHVSETTESVSLSSPLIFVIFCQNTCWE